MEICNRGQETFSLQIEVYERACKWLLEPRMVVRFPGSEKNKGQRTQHLSGEH